MRLCAQDMGADAGVRQEGKSAPGLRPRTTCAFACICMLCPATQGPTPTPPLHATHLQQLLLRLADGLGRLHARLGLLGGLALQLLNLQGARGGRVGVR